MKKVLILTTSTGQGHNQAANSLIEVFKEDGFEVIKHDFLERNSKLLNETIVKGYEISATMFPKTYGIFYKLTDHKFIQSFLSFVFTRPIHKINRLISETKPDVIIATHSFAVNIICKLKEQGLTVPFISVVTDFKAHYTYVSPLVDAYITGSEFTKKSLSIRGISDDRIYPIGIPIKENFFQSDDNIPHIKDNDYFSLLLMSGSMGLKNISYVLEELLNNEHKLRITVICGNNEGLKKSLEAKCSNIKHNKKLHILGFSHDIASFMEYSDIIISKPGGLTVTEAIAKKLPIIIPFAIPGQEMENTDFLVENGYAYYINDVKKINPLIDNLINDPILLETMSDKLQSLSKTYSIRKIIDISKDLIKKDKA